MACGKTETEIRISLFMSGDGFYFDLRIKEAGCAWAAVEDGLSVWVGCERWEMTALFAGFERRCIHEGKEGKRPLFWETC
jgi:hypothetical protein